MFFCASPSSLGKLQYFLLDCKDSVISHVKCLEECQKILIPSNNSYCHHRTGSTLKEIISQSSPLLQYYNLRSIEGAIREGIESLFHEPIFLIYISVKMLPSLFSASKNYFKTFSEAVCLRNPECQDDMGPGLTKEPGTWVFPPVHLH